MYAFWFQTPINKTLFNLEFFKFLKQAKRKKIKEKPPPFF
ncbi:hypothetical protein HPNQ4161_0173 [Helicobacter pylori NQ4161]|nr:hypothetical protein HPNQ4161_0173 [Helicobacter pylori NQ4161]